MDLIQQLKEEENMGVILITHDMAVVAENCDRVIVMYRGGSAEGRIDPSSEAFLHEKSFGICAKHESEGAEVPEYKESGDGHWVRCHEV